MKYLNVIIIQTSNFLSSLLLSALVIIFHPPCWSASVSPPLPLIAFKKFCTINFLCEHCNFLLSLSVIVK